MTAALTAWVSLSGCIFVSGHSYSYAEVDRRAPVSQTDWTGTLLHLQEPLIENVVVDLTHTLEQTCGAARLTNVQTKVMLRELILFQIYSVRLTGTCASPREGGGLAAPRPAPRDTPPG